MHAGVELEGEDPPQPTGEDVMALRVYAMLANGMGGLDWAALPLAAAFVGVADLERLVDDLVTIKLHRPPQVAGQE